MFILPRSLQKGNELKFRDFYVVKYHCSAWRYLYGVFIGTHSVADLQERPFGAYSLTIICTCRSGNLVLHTSPWFRRGIGVVDTTSLVRMPETLSLRYYLDQPHHTSYSSAGRLQPFSQREYGLARLPTRLGTN